MAFDPLAILAPDGPVARRLGDRYERRPEQEAMIAAVRDTLGDGGQLLVEAGTGVGKSFAYLLPAIERIVVSRQGGDDTGDGEGTAVPSGAEGGDDERRGDDGAGGAGGGRGGNGGGGRERVVISTHTIALQEQIVQRDVPLLQAVLGEEFSAVLVKGRGNYLSLRRLMQASKKQAELFGNPDVMRALHGVEDWAYDTTDGSLATLPQLGAGQWPVWEKVQSDAGNCMGRRCPLYDKCFYQQARRRMENADLLIVNHALFFADLALRAEGVGLLPPYDHVILDEAHMVEDVASTHFGLSVSESQVRFLLGALLNSRTGRGFLASMTTSAATDPIIARAVDQVAGVEVAASAFFDDLVRYQQTHGRSNGRLMEPRIVSNALSEPIEELATTLGRLRDKAEEEPDKYELASYIGRCRSMSATLQALLEQSEPEHVYWLDVSRSGRNRRVEFASSPIDVGPMLRERLFEATRPRGKGRVGVVMTSATLCTGGEGGRGGGGKGGGGGGGGGG
ncbi:MAG: DEAD/DEAH box helicase, partial [Phycisphaeraceae bacterium]